MPRVYTPNFCPHRRVGAPEPRRQPAAGWGTTAHWWSSCWEAWGGSRRAGREQLVCALVSGDNTRLRIYLPTAVHTPTLCFLSESERGKHDQILNRSPSLKLDSHVMVKIMQVITSFSQCSRPKVICYHGDEFALYSEWIYESFPH